MSEWLLKRQQEAFSLYRRYIAMQLHLKAGSSFDYTTYGGSVRASFDSFKDKPQVLKRFIQLSLAVHPDDHELFVFANARYGIDIGYGDIRKCVKQFENWKTKFGNKEAFMDNALIVFKRYCNGDDYVDMSISMMMSDDDQEALISWMHAKKDLTYKLTEKIGNNAIYELVWNKLNKIRSLYYHFGILN